MHISEIQHKTAGEFVDLIASKLGSDRAVHPETAIACAARLAGSLLYRSFTLNVHGLRPGDVCLSHEAYEEGPGLVNSLLALLQHFEFPFKPAQLDGTSPPRGGAPHLSVLESLALLQEDAMRIVRTSGMGTKEAAGTCAMATAFIVKECARDIGADVAFNIAAFGFVEGSKTVPPALAAGSLALEESKPWYKFW
jgi:hypothetical protein